MEGAAGWRMSNAGGGDRRNNVRSLANETCHRGDDFAFVGAGFWLATPACDVGRFVVPPLPDIGMATCVIKGKCSDRTRL